MTFIYIYIYIHTYKVDTSNMKNALAGLSAVLDAASFSLNDRKKLVAPLLVQGEPLV